MRLSPEAGLFGFLRRASNKCLQAFSFTVPWEGVEAQSSPGQESPSLGASEVDIVNCARSSVRSRNSLMWPHGYLCM